MAARASWRPALRIAWRDARRHKLATGLAALLVALPIVGAVVVATVHSSTDWYSENGAYQRMGAADASVEVSRSAAVRVGYRDRGTYVVGRPARGPQTPTRNPHDVNLEALLPEGSRLTPSPGWRLVRLDTGGRLTAQVLDLDDPISTGLARLTAGEAPAEPDEIALPPDMAETLGLVDDDGSPRADATVATANAGTLRVVGLVDDYDPWGVQAVVPPSTHLFDATRTRSWLADLPPLSVAQMHDLRDTAAAQGVVVLFRDAVQHPEHWPELDRATVAEEADPMSLAIGAMVIGFGLVEVVLLVGAALAVGARRQIRTLGLLASAGGEPRDVRRVVLARGLLVGGGASLVAVVTGLVGLRLALPEVGRLTGSRLLVMDVVWSNVVVIGLLGAVSGVLAAVYPAWVVGRMSAVDALAGRFPSGHQVARLHPPALWLSGVGLAGVVASGFWIAVEYAPQDTDGPASSYAKPSLIPVLVGGLCLLALLAGLVWMTPYVVQWLGAASRRLGLAARLAVRDATRHRQRTSAAAVGLIVTVAGAVFAGFGVDAAVAADEAHDPYLPPDTGVIYARAGDDAAVQRLEQTMHDAIGTDAVVRLAAAEVASVQAHRDVRAVAGVLDGGVQIVDETFLRLAGVDHAAVRAYWDGAALVTEPRLVTDGEIDLESGRRKPVRLGSIAAHVVPVGWESRHVVGEVWISPATAAALGAEAGGGVLLAHKAGGFEPTDEDVLLFYGIQTDGSLSGSTDGYGLLALAVVAGALLVTALACGVVVSLAAAEGSDDAATLAAVGAPPGRRRVMGAVHGTFVGVVGGGLGLLVGAAGGTCLLQVAGSPGVPVPWLSLLMIAVGVPMLAAGVGWAVTPSRVQLVRRPG